MPRISQMSEDQMRDKMRRDHLERLRLQDQVRTLRHALQRLYDAPLWCSRVSIKCDCDACVERRAAFEEAEAALASIEPVED